MSHVFIVKDSEGVVCRRGGLNTAKTVWVVVGVAQGGLHGPGHPSSERRLNDERPGWRREN